MEHTIPKVALITGGVKRIGATIARQLHKLGINLALHYRHSKEQALALQEELHTQRPNSVFLLQAELSHFPKLTHLVEKTIAHYGRLDILVNNASSFFPTPIGQVAEEMWDNLLDTNLKAPFFLSQAAIPHLQATQGCIINIVDIYGKHPLKSYPVYSIAKAGLIMLTQTLAYELGPTVRVNGIAPGAILWPENRELDEVAKMRIISKTALKHLGDPQDIAKAVVFLINDANYMTGQIMTIDGGRTLHS
jgi:pteridine reductase